MKINDYKYTCLYELVALSAVSLSVATRPHTHWQLLSPFSITLAFALAVTLAVAIAFEIAIVVAIAVAPAVALSLAC